MRLCPGPERLRCCPCRRASTLPLTLLTELFITVADADRAPPAGRRGRRGRLVQKHGRPPKTEENLFYKSGGRGHEVSPSARSRGRASRRRGNQDRRWHHYS